MVEIVREAAPLNMERWIGGGSGSSIQCIDFRAGSGGGRSSKAAEAKRFLAALRRLAECQARNTFSTGEMHSVANDIGLQVKISWE